MASILDKLFSVQETKQTVSPLPTKSVVKDVKVVEKLDNKTIIEQIHKEFETASVHLLKEAREILAKEVKVNLNKAERLDKIGFKESKDQTESAAIRLERDEATRIANIITYYAETYPKYKFITMENVNTIARKYKLVIGPIRIYKGFVPEKNLSEIEEFDKDSIKIQDLTYSGGYSYKHYKNAIEYNFKLTVEAFQDAIASGKHMNIGINPIKEFTMVAPQKDFNMVGKMVQGNTIMDIPAPDPIVLFPVNGGALIITAWGDEAEDPLVKK